jgi:hypothetical protein
METRSEEERGWNPLGIAKQGRGKPQNTLESLGVPVGEGGEVKSPNEESRAGQGVLYSGRHTCPVKRPN